MSNEPEKKKNEWVEEMEVATNDLVARVKELIEQGNVRRLIVRKKDGEPLFEIPLTPGVIAGSALLVFAPPLAALGALAAFFAEVKLEVVRVGTPEEEEEAEASGRKKIDIE